MNDDYKHQRRKPRPGKSRRPRLDPDNRTPALDVSPRPKTVTFSQFEFCLNYIANGFNATAAYKAAYPRATLRSARELGHRLLTKVDIKTFLATQLAEGWRPLHMDGDEALTPENWLATVNGTQATYLYDADGWRAKKAVTGDTTFYLRGPGGELLTEWHDLGATARARDYVYVGSHLLSAIDKPVTAVTCGGESIPDGSPTTLTIASGQTGTVTFEGSACRRVSALISASTIPNCSVFYNSFSIRGPNGTIASYGGVCAGDIVGPVVLPTSGTYSVVVDPSDTWSGQVTLSVYDVVDVTGPITFSIAVNGSLSTPGQRGYWTFNGTQSQRVSAMINTSTIANCSVFYNRFKIVSGATPNGTEIAAVGDVCTGALVGPVTLPTTDSYTVVIDPSGSWTGLASVTAYDVADASGPMTFGQTVNATLNPGQRGAWTFSGTQNQRVSVLLNSSTIPNCSVFYNSFAILKPDSTTLTSVGSVCGGTMLGPLDLPTTGTYTVVIDPSGSWSGQVSVTAYNAADVTGSLTLGQAVNTTLSPGQRGFWTFSGSQNQKVSAVINSSTMTNCASSNTFAILKPDGTTLISGGSLCTGAMLGPVVLPTTGTYTVLIDPAGINTGQVTMTTYNVVDVTRTIRLNSSAETAALTTPGQRALWTFSGKTGVQVRAIMDSSSVSNCSSSNTFAILKPDGTTLRLIASLCTGAVVGPVSLPTTGTYTVLVDPGGASTGSVTVRLVSP